MNDESSASKSACPHPEAVDTRWGDPISEERQAELQRVLDAWDAPGADHGDQKGPFDGVSLTGAEVCWLAERSGRDLFGEVPNLHLEGATLTGAHLEGAVLFGAHLEGATLVAAHLEGADLTAAHLEGAVLEGANLEGATLTDAVGL